MKKLYTLIAGLTLTFASAKVMGQNFSIPDTVRVTTGGYTDGHAPVNNMTSGPIVLQWRCIATNMPADWLNVAISSIGFCDNNACVDYTSAINQQTSTSYAPGTSGELKMSLNLANVTSQGCYYARVRANIMGFPNDSLVTTFVFCRQPASVPSVKAVDEVMLYPNPASSEVNVVFDEAADVKSIGVYNIIGKLVSVYKVNGKSANLNIESIPAGIYFVRLMNAQGQVVVTRKFTKQ